MRVIQTPRGEILGEDFDAFSGSLVNIFGSEFFIEGLALDSLLVSQGLTILDRDVTLTGILASGEQFSFDLNSTNSPSTDFFSSDATITVTASVPEPSSSALISLVLAIGLLRRSRSCQRSSVK